MKALMLADYRRLEYCDAPDPQIAPDEALVAVRACGICGSDVHGFDGSTGRRRPPLIMGHEASGVIAAVGANVCDWKPGDRVTFDSTIWCGRCAFCRAGQINLCDRRRVLGVSCDDYRRHGAFAQYVAIPQHILCRMPDGLTFEQAAMVEPVSIAVHAVGRTQIKLGDTAVVVGAGMIGSFVIQALRAAGCGRIIAVDLNRERLDFAQRLGADDAILADDPQAIAQIHAGAGGRGADAAFEVVGISPAVQTAIQAVRKGGQVTLVGNLAAEVALPLQAVATRELTLRGCCASAGEYPACLDMIAQGKIDVDCLRSATAPLAEGAAWFERLYAGERGLMKVVLRPEEL